MGRRYTVPLAGPYDTRIATGTAVPAASGIVGIGIVGIMIVGNASQSTDRDRRNVNCFTQTVGKDVNVVKRPGWGTGFTPWAGHIGNAILVWTGSVSGTDVVTALGETDSNIYIGNTLIGSITGKCTGITESVTGATAATLAFTSSDNTGWYTTSLAVTTALTFTGDTHTNTTVDNISSTVGLLVGQLLTGTGFAANTRIASIDSATQVTTTLATTATNAGVTITRTILAKIIDADFPGNAGKTLAGTFSHVEGFACILTTDGLLYAGDINTMSAWTANSFDSANTSPDKGRASFTHKDRVVALGAESMELWKNAGLTPFPLARVDGNTMKVGVVSADAIAQISDTSWWCGSTPQGGLSIFQYDGTLSRVSPPAIDAILILAGASNISLTTLRNYGYSFVYVTAGPIQFAYCVEEKFWFEVKSETPLVYKAAGISQGSTMVNYAISKVSTSGKVYSQSHAALVFTDDGVSYSAIIQTKNEDHGTNKLKFYGYQDIVADIEASESLLTISKSDNDFQTVEVLDTVDLSQQRKRITQLGAAEQRAWVYTHSSATPMRLKRAEGELEIGN